MRTSKAVCEGGPLDGQTVEVPPSLFFEVVFHQGKSGNKSFVYGYEAPEGVELPADDWTTVDWIAKYHPDIP